MKFAGASILKVTRKSGSAAVRLFAISLAVLVMFSVTANTAFAVSPCTGLGGTTSTWTHGTSGTWSTGSNWDNGFPNSATTSACIADGTSTVTLDMTANVDDLQLFSGNTLDFNPNTSLTVNGTQILNAGQININGGGNSNSYLYLPTSVLLSGGGTLTLNTTTTGGGGNAYLYLYNNSTLDNVDNTIQGEGIINNNGTTIKNESGGTINANSTGSPLINTLTLEYGNVTNAGLMVATNSGILQLYSTTVNNAGGNITVNGANASVYLLNSTIQGGTLNQVAGFLGTPSGYVGTLDGSTGAGAVTIKGTYTSDFNSNTYLYGSIINKGNVQLNGGGNTNTYLYFNGGNPTLTGGGTVSLNTTTTGGGGNAYFYLYNAATLDNVNNTIQGEGIVYNNGTTFNNHAAGVINANSTGSPLINTLALDYGTFNNQGLMEATNSGTLQFYSTTVNNSGGGVIAANGAGASVQVLGSTIQGGTLNNNGGAFFGTPSGYTAYLDGSTGAGAVTIKGTYTSDYNTNTFVYGTINNQGNLQVNGGNNTNTYLYVNTGTVTLTGGGTVSLHTDTSGGGGNANLYLYNGATLDNINNTIQGEGFIYNNGTTLINEAAGTILANSTGSPFTTALTIQYGTVTNNGTMQVNAGDLLHLYQANLTNYGANTLTGGTYNVYGTTSNPGTLQVDSLGNSGGEIVNNAATILLNGPNSNFVDQAGLDALSNFSNNTSTGSFSIQAGRNFSSPGSFANAGAVNVGTGSTFTTSAGNFNQSGGNTKVDGTLTAGANFVNVSGGTLSGNGGTINGTVNMNAGTMSPGDAAGTAGALTIVGNYVQLAAGIFQLDVGGATGGSQFDMLSATGTASLSGTLDISLIHSFTPSNGQIFTFLLGNGGVSGLFGTVNGLNYNNGYFTVVYNPNNVELAWTTNQTGVPEPGTFLMLGSGLLGVAYTARRRWLK